MRFWFLFPLLLFLLFGEWALYSQEPDKPRIIIKRLSEELNGEGRKEFITFACYTTQETYDFNRFVLEVNDKMVVSRGHNLDREIRIVDIDARDNYKEIAIPESGPSDDYATHFFCFLKDSIIDMGTIPGSHKVKIDGSGVIQTYQRGAILHTWFFPAEYKLDEKHKLVFVESDLYSMNTKVVLKDKLPLQRSSSDATIIFTLGIGDHATIIGSDNEKWCL